MAFKSYRTFRGRKLRLSGGVQFQEFCFSASSAHDEQTVERSELFQQGHIIVVPGSSPPTVKPPDPVDEFPQEAIDAKTIATGLADELATMQKAELQELIKDADIKPEGRRNADLVRALVLHNTGVDIAADTSYD